MAEYFDAYRIDHILGFFRIWEIPMHAAVSYTHLTNDSEITFKIQILTSSKPLAKNDKRLKGLKEVDYYKEGGIYLSLIHILTGIPLKVWSRSLQEEI